MNLNSSSFFLADIEATAIMQGERFSKRGKTYFNVKDFLVDFSIGHASVRLDNLFNGDQQLGKFKNIFYKAIFFLFTYIPKLYKLR